MPRLLILPHSVNAKPSRGLCELPLASSRLPPPLPHICFLSAYTVGLSHALHHPPSQMWLNIAGPVAPITRTARPLMRTVLSVEFCLAAGRARSPRVIDEMAKYTAAGIASIVQISNHLRSRQQRTFTHVARLVARVMPKQVSTSHKKTLAQTNAFQFLLRELFFCS